MPTKEKRRDGGEAASRGLAAMLGSGGARKAANEAGKRNSSNMSALERAKKANKR